MATQVDGDDAKEVQPHATAYFQSYGGDGCMWRIYCCWKEEMNSIRLLLDFGNVSSWRWRLTKDSVEVGEGDNHFWNGPFIGFVNTAQKVERSLKFRTFMLSPVCLSHMVLRPQIQSGQ